MGLMPHAKAIHTMRSTPIPILMSMLINMTIHTRTLILMTRICMPVMHMPAMASRYATITSRLIG